VIVMPLCQINLVPDLCFKVMENSRALGRKILVELVSSKELAWVAEVDQTPEPLPQAPSLAMAHGAPHFMAKPQICSAGNLVQQGKLGAVALGSSRLAGSH